MGFAGAQGNCFRKKNLKSKIWCHTPFKESYFGSMVMLRTGTVLSNLKIIQFQYIGLVKNLQSPQFPC
jgi:hypothetical protein